MLTWQLSIQTALTDFVCQHHMDLVVAKVAKDPDLPCKKYGVCISTDPQVLAVYFY